MAKIESEICAFDVPKEVIVRMPTDIHNVYPRVELKHVSDEALYELCAEFCERVFSQSKKTFELSKFCDVAEKMAEAASSAKIVI